MGWDETMTKRGGTRRRGEREQREMGREGGDKKTMRWGTR
jgi:hypothetical protein